MRRVIIGTAMFAAYLFVFLATISGGLAGYAYGKTLGVLAAVGNPQALPLILGVVGLVAGFLLASVSAAVLFLLREIAANTRPPTYDRDPYDEQAARSLR